MQERLKIGDLVRCTTDKDVGLVIDFEEGYIRSKGDPICLWFKPDFDDSYIYSCSRAVIRLIKPKKNPVVID